MATVEQQDGVVRSGHSSASCRGWLFRQQIELSSSVFDASLALIAGLLSCSWQGGAPQCRTLCVA